MIVAAIFVVTALLLMNAVYVGAEFAAVSVRRSRVKELADDGNLLAARLLPVLEAPAAGRDRVRPLGRKTKFVPRTRTSA